MKSGRIPGVRRLEYVGRLEMPVQFCATNLKRRCRVEGNAETGLKK
jgi:hypothetical protein